MRYVYTAAKAIAAVITVIIASGILTGHWLTEAEIILGVVNGAVVYLVPNHRAVVTGAHAAPVQSNGVQG